MTITTSDITVLLGGFLFGIIVLALSQAVIRWAYGRHKHHTDQAAAILQRLSEIVVAIKQKPVGEDPLLRQIHTNLDEIHVAFKKQSGQMLVALGVINESIDRLIQVQNAFVHALYGGEIPNVEDTSEKRKLADRLKRRYDLSDEDALARAEAMLIYQHNGGMNGGEA